MNVLIAEKTKMQDDLKEVAKQFLHDYPNHSNIITRNYYRENGQFTETEYSRHFQNFTKFKNETFESFQCARKGYHRNDIRVIKDLRNNSIGKRYIVSAIVAGAPVNKQFMQTIQHYCKINNAQLILLTMRGVNKNDTFDSKIYNEYHHCFATELLFNNNLRAQDFKHSPQKVIPISGLNRYGQKGYSVIIAGTKQFLKPVPQKNCTLPHLVLSTGTICTPEYPDTTMGKYGEQDNCLGGLIVEIRDNDIFHIRHIQADRVGGFQDLEKYYYGCKKPEKRAAAGIVAEPHYGIEDPTSIHVLKEIIHKTKTKRIFFHDVCDCRSITHHEKNNIKARLNRPEIQRNLETELNYLGNAFMEWNRDFPDLDMYVVPSNHELFINTWLLDGSFVNDDNNALIGADLFKALLNNERPIEHYLRTHFTIKNLTFLGEQDSYKINGIELNYHGHKGSNGARFSSPTSLEESFGKSTTSHTHSPLIWRDTWRSGCNCILQQDYNSDSSSSWLHANVVHYENGSRQLIIAVGKHWKL